MAQNSGLMQGKRGVILGVANNRSIAWGIAKACRAAGAEIALTWQGDALKKRVEPLAKELGGILLGHCDVTDPATIDAVFEVLKEKWGKIDFVVHAIAFSDKDQLDGRYLETTADNFSRTMLITCYSLTAIAQRAEKLMTDGGSILTLTYYGAEKWMPHYNVMGVAKAALEASVRYLAADLGEKNIRVNAISAGPIKTLAASGIGDFRYILKWNEYNAPLRRTVTIEEVGDSALYLLSDMSRGVTGEVHHVDSGYHVVGMKHPDAPDISLSNSLSEGIAAASMPAPIDLLHPPRRDRRGTRKAASRARRIFRSTSSAARRPSHAGEILADLFARDGRDAASLAFVASPLGRARADHGVGARRAETAAGRLSRSTTGCARSATANGKGSTLPRDAGCTTPRRFRRAPASTNGASPPPGGESYASVQLRMRDWYDSLIGRHRRGRPWRHRAGADGGARHRDAGQRRRLTDRAGRGLRVRRRRAGRSIVKTVPRRHAGSVRAGAIRVLHRSRTQAWMAGACPAMTKRGLTANAARYDMPTLTIAQSDRAKCPSTPSATCSGSRPSAKATGSRSAAWSMAARRCCR